MMYRFLTSSDILWGILLLLQPVFPKLYLLPYSSYLHNEVNGHKNVGDSNQQPGPIEFIMSNKENNKRDDAYGSGKVDQYIKYLQPSL